MYKAGERIVYGTTGVCMVESVGPLSMRGATKGQDYYTLAPMYQSGRIFAPVNTDVFIRPALTRDEAMKLIYQMPTIEGDFLESSNPRQLNEHYQGFLKSGDCADLVRVIHAVSAKAKHVAEKGRKLGQVDQRSMKQARQMLHNELAQALDIEPDEVPPFIARTLGETGVAAV